jgi:hypothetical protein
LSRQGKDSTEKHGDQFVGVHSRKAVLVQGIAIFEIVTPHNTKGAVLWTGINCASLLGSFFFLIAVALQLCRHRLYFPEKRGAPQAPLNYGYDDYQLSHCPACVARFKTN